MAANVVSLLSHPVGGLGFGVISSVVTYANVIEAATGPGIVGILDPTEDSQFFVLTGGMFVCTHASMFVHAFN